MTDDLRDTLADPRTLDATQPRTADESHVAQLAGYELGQVIGRGGMGEVVLARDLRIGRDVAIKRLRDTQPTDDLVLRFLREAKIQARLDHPAIVPVHELGTDANGQPFFTMKRLAGTTLAELIARGSETRQRLLRAFVDVALAIDLAHARLVVHRDLKPANIMLGDYGEVYVLDWGLARDLASTVRDTPLPRTATPVSGVTAIGSLLGTPGYMPPEQIQDASSVDAGADSYALGAILFEILTGEPVHPPDDPISSTLVGVDSSPARRCPDRSIPPELDQLCCEALAVEPVARPTARALAERVQSYLDGDRDLAMRRHAASEAVEQARHALGEARLEDAMRSAGRALALDPTSPALEIVSRVMLEPTEHPSPELAAELRQAEHRRSLRQAYRARWMFLFVPLLMGGAILNGVATSWLVIGAMTSIAIGLSGAAQWMCRAREGDDRPLHLYAALGCVLVAVSCRVCSPLLLTPGLAGGLIMALVAYPAFTRRPWPVILGVMLGWVIPVVLEYAGILPSTWRFENNVLEIRSYAIELRGAATTAWLITTTLLIFLIGGLLASGVARANHLAQQQLLTQRWRLGHLIPAGDATRSREMLV